MDGGGGAPLAAPGSNTHTRGSDAKTRDTATTAS